MRLHRVTFKPWASLATRYAVAGAIRDMGATATVEWPGNIWRITWGKA
jgi:hypothetical protein